MKPKLFIGSSTESLNIAYAIQQNLLHDSESTVWSQGVFEIAKTTIESLNKILNHIDFGVFVFNPDDITKIRGNSYPTVRDNIIFEIGLFIGKLGRERVFFIIPNGSELHIPTDLSGVTPGFYESDREDKNYEAATGAVCFQIRNIMKKLGPLNAVEDEEGTENVNYENIEENSDWVIDFFEGNYISAKAKIELELRNLDKVKLKTNQTWLEFIKYKIDEKVGLHELTKLAEKNITDISVQCLIARMLLWEDLDSHSVEILSKALEVNPSEPELTLTLSECYASNTNKSIEILEKNQSKNDSRIIVKLSQLYKDNNQQAKALEILHSAYLNAPNDELILTQYSKHLYESNKYKEALYLLNKLIRKYPENPNHWGNLSNCCLSLELYDNAFRACKKAEELSQGTASWILSNLGNILNNKGLYGEAIYWLQKSILIQSDSDYAHDRLSKAIKNKQDEDLKLASMERDGENLLKNIS
ncbi:nucleotide-binding protein [Leptospira yasudae]|uniref:TIR domain-containing protein n=1 Tax=Leptospira yasudae TaxID=2202201 RepID=UPI001C4F4BCE|nr:TIR domain-containing protein [Leptospira yasudae]MBW0435211.1 nucleotide-binding protein [Leptospira yasudae]